MAKTIDLAGRRFGRLIAQERASNHPSGRSPRWLCLCDCGKPTLVIANHLLRGDTKSCGCLQAELTSARKTKHGASHSPEYEAYRAAKYRCQVPGNKSYSRYGGRGIEFKFVSFESFLDEVGQRPSDKHSLDRIDNSLGYEPGNVRWASPQEQQRNRRNNVLLTFQGKKQCVAAWAEELGICRRLVTHRLRRGWSVEDALTRPAQQKSRK